MRRLHLALAAACVVVATAASVAAGDSDGHRHRRHSDPPCFATPHVGLFTQENASTALPAPGQHPDFGALVPWAGVRARAAACAPTCRLIFLVRHAQAVSNVVQAAVGSAVWESDVARRCSYNGSTLFDAELTQLGRDQATALAAALGDAADLTTGLPPPVTVVSPLTRTLTTADLALGKVLPADIPFKVTELARERVGVNTCDARRAASDGGRSACGRVATGLRSSFAGPRFHAAFRIIPSSWWPPRKHRGWSPPRALGLAADADVEWTARARETDESLRTRARALLATIWRDTPPGAPVFVVSHSGMIPALLEVIGREPYPPVNAELVPALVSMAPC